MVVLPNHIKKFMKATKILVAQILEKKRNGSFNIPHDINNLLIGPLSENNAKNNIEKADAMIKFGK